jgi:hypothetical protein
MNQGQPFPAAPTRMSRQKQNRMPLRSVGPLPNRQNSQVQGLPTITPILRFL